MDATYEIAVLRGAAVEAIRGMMKADDGTLRPLWDRLVHGKPILYDYQIRYAFARLGGDLSPAGVAVDRYYAADDAFHEQARKVHPRPEGASSKEYALVLLDHADGNVGCAAFRHALAIAADCKRSKEAIDAVTRALRQERAQALEDAQARCERTTGTRGTRARNLLAKAAEPHYGLISSRAYVASALVWAAAPEHPAEVADRVEEDRIAARWPACRDHVHREIASGRVCFAKVDSYSNFDRGDQIWRLIDEEYERRHGKPRFSGEHKSGTGYAHIYADVEDRADEAAKAAKASAEASVFSAYRNAIERLEPATAEEIAADFAAVSPC